MKRINSIVKHELRKAMCNQFDGRCAYCKRQIGMKGTVDHYLPQALGGTNAKDNLRWCCKTCNQLKSDMPPEEWEKRIPVPFEGPSKRQRKIELLEAIAPLGRPARRAQGRIVA